MADAGNKTGLLRSARNDGGGIMAAQKPFSLREKGLG
jgi:hypothetical protein